MYAAGDDRLRPFTINGHLWSAATITGCPHFNKAKDCHKNPTGLMRASDGEAVCRGQEMAISERSPLMAISDSHQLSLAIPIPMRPGSASKTIRVS
jgi:hypothetical protein